MTDLTAAPGKIVTENIYPPIPIRPFDWCAYFEGDEEAGLRGWGVTERAAITDLLEQVEADCRICHHAPARSCATGGCPHGGDL